MKRRKIILAAFIIAAISSIICGVCIGSVFVPFTAVFKTLANQFFGAGYETDEIFDAIVWNLRLPRTLLAFCVGAALSVSGAVMQSVLKNPLASSHTVGVSSGAALGAGAAVSLGLTFAGSFTTPLAAMTVGMLTVFAAVSFAVRIDKSMGDLTIVLVGMIFSLFINSVLTIMMVISRESLQRVIYWQMGSFSRKNLMSVAALAPAALLGILIILRFSREMDIMTFGDEQAMSLGVPIRKMKWLLLAVSSVLTGAAISFAGVIGFVDLIAPHVARRFFGAGHKYVIPVSALFGGAFMVFCDVAARSVPGGWELPVGAVTAMIGAPFFAVIYFRKGRTGYDRD